MTTSGPRQGTEIDTKMNNLAHHPQEVNRVLIPGLYNSDSDDCRKHKHKKDKHKKQSHSRERKDKKKGPFFFTLHYRKEECSV